MARKFQNCKLNHSKITRYTVPCRGSPNHTNIACIVCFYHAYLSSSIHCEDFVKNIRISKVSVVQQLIFMYCVRCALIHIISSYIYHLFVQPDIFNSSIILCICNCIVLFSIARKSDQWFAVDPATGTKLHSFTPDGVLGTCPIVTSPAGTLYIGRSGKHLAVHCTNS